MFDHKKRYLFWDGESNGLSSDRLFIQRGSCINRCNSWRRRTVQERERSRVMRLKKMDENSTVRASAMTMDVHWLGIFFYFT
jgi:hypothetical protein